MGANTPQDVDRLFGEYLNAGNVDGIVALYEPRATFVPQEGEHLVGHDLIRGAISGFVTMKPKIQMNVVRAVPVGDDVAVLYNEWRMTITPPGGAAVEVAGKATEIVRRQADGTWRFIFDD